MSENKMHCLGIRCPTQFDPNNPRAAYNCTAFETCPYADIISDESLFALGVAAFSLYMLTKDLDGGKLAEKYFNTRIYQNPNTKEQRCMCDEKLLYDDIYREFLSTFRWYENQIMDWRPVGPYKIKVWTKAGPVYIYDYTTKQISLEVNDESKDTF